MEEIETTVRDQVLEHVSPQITFFIGEKTGTESGCIRTIRSCVDRIKMTQKQASRLGIEPYRQLSPLREKCCLLFAANESFQDAENDLKVLTGIEVGHSTHHRQVQKLDLSPSNIKQKLTEVCLDGGKVRLRSHSKGKPAYWKEYKIGRLQGIYYGAFFQDNFALINWVNSKNLTRTVYHDL